MGSLATNTIRRVAVVGGGPLGVSTAKYLLAERVFDRVDVYEQSGSVEGTWCHTSPSAHERTIAPQTSPDQPLPAPEWQKKANGELRPSFTTPMYDVLETNLSKQLMKFSDLPFPEDAPLFPRRETVSKYIDEYAADIKHLIQFGTQVTDIQLEIQGIDTWILTSKNLYSGAKTTKAYDAVAVCTGHYYSTFVPAIEGLTEWNRTYAESVLHSKFYRSPEPFKDKKVLVVGNGASGTDIANQISFVSKRPLLASQRSESYFATPDTPEGQLKLEVPEIARFIDPSQANRAIEFVDGHVENDIDVVLFATGYLYNFPFLNNAQLEIIKDGMRIEKTYQHVFHREHPSLAFFGMPFRIVPFPLCEAQAAAVARVWSGRLNLPPMSEMIEWEQATITQVGDGRRFHYLDFPKDVNYIRRLYNWSLQAKSGPGKLPEWWGEKHYWMREQVPLMRRAYTAQGEAKKNVKNFDQLGFDFDEWKKQQEISDERV